MKKQDSINITDLTMSYYDNNCSDLDQELSLKLKNSFLYSEIIESKIFNRLKDIKFLGAIDYLNENKRKKRHTRYEHTISVAKLALRYSQLAKLTPKEEEYLVCGALLHDIGHAPLSHSMEPAFKQRFNLSHHLAGLNIIVGNSPLGREIFSILTKHHIKIQMIIDLLNGNSKEKYAYAFNNPINIDTIDGIMRSYSYLTTDQNINNKFSLQSNIFQIIDAVWNKDQFILDGFWRLKNRVYSDLINTTTNIYADYFSRQFVLNENDIKVEDFYLSEREFKKKYIDLFKGLLHISKTLELETELSYIKRFYDIKQNIVLNDICDFSCKYIYEKEKHTVKIKAKAINHKYKNFTF